MSHHKLTCPISYNWYREGVQTRAKITGRQSDRVIKVGIFSASEWILPIVMTVYEYTLLKLTFMKYPAIHTNYIISHSTTLPYNHNI